MKGIAFRGFVVTVSVAMLVSVYGTFVMDMLITIIGVAFGLIATVIGWLGFIMDLKHDADVETV